MKEYSGSTETYRAAGTPDRADENDDSAAVQEAKRRRGATHSSVLRFPRKVTQKAFY